MLQIHPYGFQITCKVKQCITCQHTNYHNTTNLSSHAIYALQTCMYQNIAKPFNHPSNLILENLESENIFLIDLCTALEFKINNLCFSLVFSCSVCFLDSNCLPVHLAFLSIGPQGRLWLIKNIKNKFVWFEPLRITDEGTLECVVYSKVCLNALLFSTIDLFFFFFCNLDLRC